MNTSKDISIVIEYKDHNGWTLETTQVSGKLYRLLLESEADNTDFANCSTPSPSKGWFCTRPHGHEGPHVAHGSGVVGAAWSENVRQELQDWADSVKDLETRTNLDYAQADRFFGDGSYYIVTNDAPALDNGFMSASLWTTLAGAVKYLAYNRTVEPAATWYLFDNHGYIVPGSVIEAEIAKVLR